MLFYKELSRKDTGFQNISILPSPEHDGWLGTVVNWVCGREETYWVFMEPRAGLRPGTPQKRHFDCDYQCTHVFILKCRGWQYFYHCSECHAAHQELCMLGSDHVLPPRRTPWKQSVNMTRSHNICQPGTNTEQSWRLFPLHCSGRKRNLPCFG